MEIVPSTPAAKVIHLFGGYEAVRQIVGLRSTVQVRRWEYPREKGGHAGQVPARHHPALLKQAVEDGKSLTLTDLMPWLKSDAADPSHPTPATDSEAA